MDTTKEYSLADIPYTPIYHTTGCTGFIPCVKVDKDGIGVLCACIARAHHGGIRGEEEWPDEENHCVLLSDLLHQ